MKRLVVKIGSSTLTTGEGRIDHAYLEELARQVEQVRSSGWQVVIVSSGAIACGLERLGMSGKRPDDMPTLQAAASVGQGLFASAWGYAFGKCGTLTSTVLLTRRDTADRTAYLHARDTLERLLELGVVPIVNENDTVSVEQIRFGDNDTLGALVACLIGADLAIILSDVEGLYDANPRRRTRMRSSSSASTSSTRTSRWRAMPARQVGSGGMVTKVKAARVLGVAGIPLVICSGRRPDVVVDAACGRAWARCSPASVQAPRDNPAQALDSPGRFGARVHRGRRRGAPCARAARGLASRRGRVSAWRAISRKAISWTSRTSKVTCSRAAGCPRAATRPSSP